MTIVEMFLIFIICISPLIFFIIDLIFYLLFKVIPIVFNKILYNIKEIFKNEN